MGGLFAATTDGSCTRDIFFGTDYHSHLGTQRGGLAVRGPEGFSRIIHDITNTQFRSKFDDELSLLKGSSGIGVISDYEDQPILVHSSLGNFAIATVGVVQNAEELAGGLCRKNNSHFAELGGGGINPTELVAALICEKGEFAEGIHYAQSRIRGSCSMVLLTDQGIYAARDAVGRTPLVLGKAPHGRAVASESCAFPNLEYRLERFMGPGEIVRITRERVEPLRAPGKTLRMCAFFWVYYGYPASSYENINVEEVRYRCGAALARRDNVEIDLVSGVPDSGTAHALGYANAAGVPYRRPFVKYTPTWPRSFMPQNQEVRDLVARMKLLPVRELLDGKRILFCEDSIVRGTQLKDIVQRLFDDGARELHMRAACPPLLYACPYLNFSRTRSLLDLATRKALREIEGDRNPGRDLSAYLDPDSAGYRAMVENIRSRLKLTTLSFQRLDDMIEAIGLPKEKLCTHCWDACRDCEHGCDLPPGDGA